MKGLPGVRSSDCREGGCGVTADALLASKDGRKDGGCGRRALVGERMAGKAGKTSRRADGSHWVGDLRSVR